MSLLSLLSSNGNTISNSFSSSQAENPVPESSQKVNFLKIKIQDNCCYFSSSEQNIQENSLWEPIKRGETITVSEYNLQSNLQSNDIISLGAGTWTLQISKLKGKPAVVCSFFNKRTQMMEQRYTKIFYKDGVYKCGPRFPKLLKETTLK